MKRVTCAAVLPCVMAFALLLAPSASAREPTPEDLAVARALFQQGSSLVNAGRYVEACPKLESAQRLIPGIGVTLYLGECYEHTGRLVRAWEQFDRARAMAEGQHDKRVDLARERAARLWPKLPKLTLVVAKAAALPGLVVTDDGVEIDAALYDVERPVEPRTHHLRARAPDRPPWETSIDVPAAPGAIRVEVPLLGEAPSAPAVPVPDPTVAPRTPGQAPEATSRLREPAPAPLPVVQSGRPSMRRITGIALFGVGAAGLVIGTSFGLDAKSKMDDSNASGHCQPNNHCDTAGLAERSSALTSATIATVAFVGGVAFMAGGAALYLTAPDDRPPGVALGARPEHGGGSVLLEGRW